ncbi:MAG: peptidyl-tRNA hydrolase Pth2 [Desulfurococcaceae archaeon]
MKQVIVVRTDLNMSRGKLAVQVAHAAVLAAIETRDSFSSWFSDWWRNGQKKIVLKVSSEAEILELYRAARDVGLPAVLVSDAGLTELPPGTITALGIGPAPSEKIDRVTGHLKTL